MADETNDTQTSTDSMSGFVVPTQVALTLNIKSPKMDYYMLTEDRLEGLQGGAESLDLTWGGIAFGCFLTALGVVIPMYVAGQSGKLFTILAGLMLPLLLLSGYWFNRGIRERQAQRRRFEKLKTESATVVTLAPK